MIRPYSAVRVTIITLLLVALIIMLMVGGVAALAYFKAPPTRNLGIKPSEILIQNVTMPIEAADAAHQVVNILVRDGRIATISEHSINVDERVYIINAAGMFITPGLIDMHVHVYDRTDLLLNLAHGVTTVRNLHGMPFHLRMKSEVASGITDGPEMVVSSPIINQPSRYAHGDHQWFPKDEAQVKQWIRRFAKQGYDLVKVYDGLSQDMFDAIVVAADEVDLPVAGHPSFMFEFEHFIAQPLQSIEHAEMLFQAPLDYQIEEPGLTQVITNIKRSDIPVDLTLFNYHELALFATQKQDYLDTIPLSSINPIVKQIMQGSIDFAINVQNPDPWMDKSVKMGRIAKRLDEAGVALLAGSDAGAGFTINGLGLVQELMRMAEVGVNPIHVLQAATMNGAKALSMGHKTGQIAVGYEADLVLTAQNPLQDFATYLSVEAVVNNGTYYSKTDIEAMKIAAKEHMNTLEFAGWYVLDQWERLVARTTLFDD